MPQMAPMNWISLYILFSMMFIFVNFLNYYIFTIKTPYKKFSKYSHKIINWKW
uniref:ATP synthase complex subunit 8 n=1 Tax=Abroscelis anchoralis TaxID=212429 RepID=A0A344ARA5_ABRAC|nr:ATP synthase F0 subunit 8 [Abroscelis anchoralis]AWX64121.1 ATP synthase F0 subunit 8 [Abroscelis anchoralis]